MNGNISSVSSQQVSSVTAGMKSEAVAKEPQQVEQQAVPVKSLQPSGFSSITYSSKGKVEPVPAQAATNAGFETYV